MGVQKQYKFAPKGVDDPRFLPRPVILITGATGAVGFGVCLRLLYQLSQPMQADLAQAAMGVGMSRTQGEEYQSGYATPNGLTLLIGCRSEAKWEATSAALRAQLKELFGRERASEQADTLYSYIDRQTDQVETLSFAEYRRSWLARLRIGWVPLDLYRARSVVAAVRTINREYGYLSHLLLNAGGGPFVAINWLGLVRAFFRDLLEAITYPDYMLEASKVSETADRLPETWQLNVFSHYLLARESLPLLAKGAKRGPSPARIVWTGSLDGRRVHFNRKDYQCLEPGQAYQSTKYQTEIVGQAFEETILRHGLEGRVTSVVAHPGVVAGNMFLPIIGRAMDAMMRWVFYFARLVLGSPHHLICAYSAALVWSHVCLAERVDTGAAVRYGVQCDRWGRPVVVREEVQKDEELKERMIDQRVVMDGCEKWAGALMRLWESETDNKAYDLDSPT